MHVALVHMRHARTGGAEQVLDRLAAFLARRGHRVTIVCRSHVEAPAEGVRFVTLRGPALGAAGRMWRFARDVERHVPAADYDVVLALGKTWTHDVVRISWTHDAYLRLARRFARSRLERAFATDWVKNRLAREIERRALCPGAYRRVIANSQRTRADLVELGVPAEAIEVVHNGVDVDRFHPRHRRERLATRRALGLDQEDLVVAFIGTGFGRKGLARLLEAFPRVVAAVPAARLLVVGRDSRLAAWRRRAERLGLGRRVVFAGERRDPERCYGAADVAVLPTHYDSFGFTVLEALASGLPIVTTDRAGASELVVPGRHGSVLAHGCGPPEIARALVEWCRADRLAGALDETRAQAERYALETSLGRIEAVLARVAEERQGAAGAAASGAVIGAASAPPITPSKS